MSDLKWKTVDMLLNEKNDTENYIKMLQSKIASQQERLKWINHYIFMKTPQELTFEEIEAKLGHKIIIKH